MDFSRPRDAAWSCGPTACPLSSCHLSSPSGQPEGVCTLRTAFGFVPETWPQRSLGLGHTEGLVPSLGPGAVRGRAQTLPLVSGTVGTERSSGGMRVSDNSDCPSRADTPDSDPYVSRGGCVVVGVTRLEPPPSASRAGTLPHLVTLPPCGLRSHLPDFHTGRARASRKLTLSGTCGCPPPCPRV